MTLVLASRWASPENRRRGALRAAHTQDAEALVDLLTFYMRQKTQREDVSTRTLRSYRIAVHDFLAFTGPPESPRVSVQNVTPEDVENYVKHTKARSKRLQSHAEATLTLGSVGTYLYGVRALYRALMWAGVVTENPAAAVPAPRDPTPAHARKRAIPAAHYRALLAAPDIHADAATASRDTVILVLGALLGLRAHEIVMLDVQDVNLELRELVVRHGKGGKQRRIPLPSAAVQTLRRWLEVRRSLDLSPAHRTLIVSYHRGHRGQPLTTAGLRLIINSYLRLVGLPADMGGAHTLRRTAGTRLYRATRDLHVVADVLGHASVATSAIYAKLDQDVRLEALEAAERQD